MQDSGVLGVYPLTLKTCSPWIPSFQLHSLWAVLENVFYEARLYFPSTLARTTLAAGFYLPIYLFSFMVFHPEHQSSISPIFFLTHVTNVRIWYSLIKLVKMSGIVNIIQYFSGVKLHLHGFGLINQVKWWDWNSLPCSMSLKICHWFQTSGANQHSHVFQLWSPPRL